MTKDQLYDKLMSAYKRHQSKNTLCKTYTDQVIKLVKEYLDSKMDVQLAMAINRTVMNYYSKDSVEELIYEEERN